MVCNTAAIHAQLFVIFFSVAVKEISHISRNIVSTFSVEVMKIKERV
jgi:hypothetical protein